MNKSYMIWPVLFLLHCNAYAEVHLYNVMLPLTYDSKCGNTQIKNVSLKEWNILKKEYDDFTRNILVFMRDNHGFDYLNHPSKTVVVLKENEEVVSSRHSCDDFLASNRKLIREAVEYNLAHPELPPIDVLSYFIQLEKGLYASSLRFHHAGIMDIIDDVFKNQPEMRDKVVNRLYDIT